MLIRRNGKLFEVFQGTDIVFDSYNFDECVTWVGDNGGFDETRKKTYAVSRKVG